MKLSHAIATTLLIASLATPAALAQPAGPGPGAGPGAGPGTGPGPGWGPGMMMGPGMMGFGGGRGMGWMCSPQSAGLAEWRKDRIERLVKPTENQRKALDDLQAASTKAAQVVTDACPKEFPASAPARLELMEKRMEAMLTALKTVRPAFDAFYATLTDEQKATLNSRGPRRWGWHGWRN
ncbi:MAG: Spy/CpxP family protein refolding chaperone [Pseudolabrys sp.]|nr:Spy/CpxP family protein refolding chaperone [Pseudolabrys sp.]